QGGHELLDGKVTIVGGGGITEALVGLLRPFRTEMTVVRRRPVAMAGVRNVLPAGDLCLALPQADAVVLTLALTDDTAGLIGEAELALMEPHAWLVNAARGPHVVTDDLARALAAGVIVR